MCRATDAFRAAIGIRDYRPGPIPHARVRKPTWHGARGRNGHGGPDIQDGELRALIAELARQHRLIRQTLEDAARWGRG